MEQHVWKVKIVILWLFQGLDYFAYILITFVETGLIGMNEPNTGRGATIAILFFIIFVLAWLSFITKPTISRWPNIIFGLLFFQLKIRAAVGLLVELSPGIVIVELCGAILAGLVIWYGWKIPNKNKTEIT